MARPPLSRSQLNVLHEASSDPSKHNPNSHVSEMQRAFIVNIVEHRMTQTAAAKAAGYAAPDVQAVGLMKQPKIKNEIARRRAEYAVASQMTKKRIIDGVLEAIEMAKIKGEPLTMVSGWREIGKMCGFYAPTQTKVEISVTGRVLVDRLQAMSDAELLRVIEGEVVDGADVPEDEEDPS